jgi:MFS family permease
VNAKVSRVVLIVGGLLFVEFLSGAVWGIHRGLSSLFSSEVLLITSFTQIGFVVSVFGVTKAMTNLGFGALSDRIGRRPIIVLGMVASSLGGAMIATARGYYGMLLGTALIGLGGGSTFVGIMVSMVEAVPSKIGLAMGLFELAAYGGSSFGTTLGGYLAMAHGLRLPFYVIVVVSVVGLVSGSLLIPETRGFVRRERTESTSISEVFSLAFMQTLPLYIAGFSSKIMDSLVWSFLPLFLTGLGMDIDGVAAIMSAYTLSWALLQPLTGHASDRLGRKRITVLGLVGAAASVLLFTLTTDFLPLLLSALVLGVAAALFYTPLVAMVSDIAPPELEGTLIGSYRFFRDMGYFVGPLILGALADARGLSYAFYATSICLLAAMIILQIASRETIKNTTFEDN